jgi:DNA/RNA-binding domain of Phe-tRNA-synthetase-like protein
MHFRVAKEVFELFPDYIVGVAMVTGADNTRNAPEDALRLGIERAAAVVGKTPREHPAVAVWREAFQKIGWNPNKFSPSIDALASRVAKSGFLPSINGAVDVINAHSLTYLLPMGAHDTARMTGDFEVRRARPGEIFTPMGGEALETVDAGEIVYADDAEVRTRRWIWRQGDKAKVTPETTMLFCPIDGFRSVNLEQVLQARESVAKMLKDSLGGQVEVFLIDIDNPSAKIS